MHNDPSNLMFEFLKQIPFISQEAAQEFIYSHLEHNEPQLAYSNLVALIVAAPQTISLDFYEKIISLGKNLDMANGILWDKSEAEEWWFKLQLKCEV
jgi:hypothetical protein